MVARKVLDGLRKGKKDVYALNIQYVKRYRLLLYRHMIHLPSYDLPSLFLQAPYTRRILTAIFNQRFSQTRRSNSGTTSPGRRTP